MPTYIRLMKFTAKGVDPNTMKNTADIVKEARERARSLGGEIRALYWTMGQYDLVSIVEAPNDETATAMAISVASRGHVTTETLRAFSEDEVKKILTMVR